MVGDSAAPGDDPAARADPRVIYVLLVVVLVLIVLFVIIQLLGAVVTLPHCMTRLLFVQKERSHWR
jgi:hypothetical protein